MERWLPSSIWENGTTPGRTTVEGTGCMDPGTLHLMYVTTVHWKKYVRPTTPSTMLVRKQTNQRLTGTLIKLIEVKL